MLNLATPECTEETEIARHTRLLSIQQWGERRATVLIGRHPSMQATLDRVHRFARADVPVLITGETGTGKELFARAIYLLSERRRRPFISVNCAQYAEGQTIASELFGHRRGSFTGAVADHKGVFEEAEGGVVFLDEVGELTPATQAMLLRVLSEGEIMPVGDTRARSVNVRVVAATNRDLAEMVARGTFREDLYYRLRFMHLTIPPLRERGDDWKLLTGFHMRQLNDHCRTEKRFSQGAVRRLGTHGWPGNIRELKALVQTSYHLCDGCSIEADDFEGLLQGRESPAATPPAAVALIPASAAAPTHIYLDHMAEGAVSFWDVVYRPFMERDMNRAEVKALVEEGLRRSNWCYKQLLETFGVAPEEYLKFMDFLRHHRLKPPR